METGPFVRPADESLSKQGYHWKSNAETYYLIGEAMGEAMKKLVGTEAATAKNKTLFGEVRVFRNEDGSKSFKATLQRYDPKTGRVTVRRVGGRTLEFALEFLHPDDRAWVKAQEDG